MSRPDTTAYSEPSSRGGSVDWSPDMLRAAELTADAGNLRLAADLCDAILADDQVQGALTTLVGALMGLPLTFEASGDKRRSTRALKALEVGEDWWTAFPTPELNLLVTWAVLLGVAVAEIVWDEDADTGRVPGTIRVWHPRHLRWDAQTRAWMLRTGDDGREIVIEPGDGRWILITPKGARRPWKSGAWRAIGRWWLLKDYAVRDWGAYSERHGTGTLVAETNTATPVGNIGEKRKTLAHDLAALGRNSTIAMPPGWTMRLVEATANTAQTFERQIELANRGISISLHGTNLTTEEGGSFAKATVLGGVHMQVIASLAEALAITLHDQHLEFWAEYNFGDRSLAPWPAWNVTPPTDWKAKADTLGSIAGACTALKSLSERVDVEAILDEYGVPLRKEAPQAAAPKLARFAQPVARGFVRGQVYADALADEARNAATRAIADDLRRVLDVVERADGYAELRDALAREFVSMSPARLADITERALVLADLSGRLSVREDGDARARRGVPRL